MMIRRMHRQTQAGQSACLSMVIYIPGYADPWPSWVYTACAVERVMEGGGSVRGAVLVKNKTYVATGVPGLRCQLAARHPDLTVLRLLPGVGVMGPGGIAAATALARSGDHRENNRKGRCCRRPARHPHFPLHSTACLLV